MIAGVSEMIILTIKGPELLNVYMDIYIIRPTDLSYLRVLHVCVLA